MANQQLHTLNLTQRDIFQIRCIFCLNLDIKHERKTKSSLIIFPSANFAKFLYLTINATQFLIVFFKLFECYIKRIF
uniref:Ovule protein n=1 Tax=Meloidogyne incognita TaxID=6306 RepID=A0A914KT08_MELIC